MATPTTHPEEECFNVYWKIKNFSYCCEQIESPEFKFSGYSHRLVLTLGFVNVEYWLSFNYKQDFKFEISFLTCDDSPEVSISGSRDVKLQIPKEVIFGNRRNAFLPEDTLTVRFRCLTKSVRGKLFICSQIGVLHKYFLWTFKYLCDHSYDYKKSAELPSLYGDIKLHLKSIGRINSDEQFSIEISRTGGERCFCVLKISLLDVGGQTVNEVSDEFVLEKRDHLQVRGFPSIIKKSKWLMYKKLMLSEDGLSLKCYLSVSTGNVSDETAVICSCENAASLQKESDELLKNFKEKTDFRYVTELQADLKSILEKGIFFDASLQIGAEIIPVHKSILSARSTVFRAMFTKDMKEAKSNTVVIEDFDVETVRGLLLYIYTDSIADEQWEIMKKLYIASDKYQVLSLKKKCVSFLKTKLSVSNVCEALILDDLYQDANLKTAAIDFISEYDSAIFASEEWKELETNNSSLAFQVLREICCSKRIR